jgi:hypothetical protein
MEMDVFFSLLGAPPESYSRQLDKRVQSKEKPYGYESSPPPADTGDFDQARLESKKVYSPHRR